MQLLAVSGLDVQMFTMLPVRRKTMLHSLKTRFEYDNNRNIIDFIASYASRVLAVIVCPSVRLSVCHKSELYKDG